MGGVVKKVAKPFTDIVKTGVSSILGGGRFLGMARNATVETTRAIEQTAAKAAKPAPPKVTPGAVAVGYGKQAIPKEAISPKEAVRGEGQGAEDAAKRTRKRRGFGAGARGILGQAPTAKKTLLGG